MTFCCFEDGCFTLIYHWLLILLVTGGAVCAASKCQLVYFFTSGITLLAEYSCLFLLDNILI